MAMPGVRFFAVPPPRPDPRVEVRRSPADDTDDGDIDPVRVEELLEKHTRRWASLLARLK
jgi:hypothetical protein